MKDPRLKVGISASITGAFSAQGRQALEGLSAWLGDTNAAGGLLVAARRLDFTTFYGRFKLDPASARQIGHAMVVVQWQGDEKLVVWPPKPTGT